LGIIWNEPQISHSRRDDSQKSSTISIDNAPLLMKNLLIDFSILVNNGSSKLQVSIKSNQTQENAKMIEGISALYAMD